ncbi:MAG: Holliday junction branch migration DNA helicase RuvB [Candidatus Onthovivens sp.]|nr:Holliday junction branch migration DNA helicase RuvB [Mollicutes bacterium]MDY2725189.1 Holliday junction branch migration DNA helicase RuvB [Candidatus Onthovivens sp.]MCI6615200.1 Holliday junction branch migration DNA helicase RuvB [Mollicutes bacterium]MCI7039434.1 Holliday junction branch migration DNA helicase RuvB [Mollicutes bacterium]MCI7268119.1 Holliday junction branch migration DNA helicase RuvB [Mollicutes bacterium]
MSETNNLFRPNLLSDFVGQDEIVNKLKIYIYSAKERNETLDHTLFYGPPGVGKTSLAFIIAHEFNSKIKVVSAPTLKTIGDLVGILSILDPGDVLFVDEIHRLDKSLEEILYSVLEDFKLNITFKNSEQVKLVNFDISPFTFIGATTQIALISSPLRDRFGITFKFDYYTVEEISKIIRENTIKMGFSIDNSEAIEIAKRSRKTPRIANNLLKRIVDFTIYENSKKITKQILNNAFAMLKIDKDGLRKEDIDILKLMFKKFKNVPISLEVIASYIGENVNNIRDVYESYLVNEGYIERTKRGRILTLKGIKKCEEVLLNDDF